MDIVLASKSPRRQELLNLIGVKDFRIVPSEKEEETDENLTPEETVKALALLKGRDVAEKCGKDSLIIAADTLVFIDGVLLGKPKDEADAKNMLLKLSGREHTVFTGVAVIRDGKELAEYEKTDVYFRHMEDAEIDAYIKSGIPMDKAGAYGIQGAGAVFVEKIDGDFYNVVGLPLCRLYKMLGEFGVTLF